MCDMMVSPLSASLLACSEGYIYTLRRYVPPTSILAGGEASLGVRRVMRKGLPMKGCSNLWKVIAFLDGHVEQG